MITNSPKRRATRQRSGFKVSGGNSGNESQIAWSRLYDVGTNSLKITLENTETELVPQFESGIGMVAIGGYIKLEKDAQLTFGLTVRNPDDKSMFAEKQHTLSLAYGVWHKFGLHIEIDEATNYDPVTLNGFLEIVEKQGEALGKTYFYGVNLDAISEYATATVVDNFGENAYENFCIKQSLYYPEIFYWANDQSFVVEPQEITGEIIDNGIGEQLVIKACNRCARFLPIDAIQEKNTLGFSNHCGKRAPCTHAAFSVLTIENADEIAEYQEGFPIVSNEQKQYVHLHHGFQLECRPCKKFKVNAPLNPARNSAQRREDSLRRRAFEVLCQELLGTDWIFYQFRRQNKAEFDSSIWEKFDKKCFACGKDLPRVKDMDLDHTLPLAYLWPLDEHATCLCSSCNGQKSDRFPFEFPPYLAPGKLEELAEITGIDPRLLLDRRKHINPSVIDELRSNIVWFFDDFLARDDYQKIREGKKAADIIVASLGRILYECSVPLNLVDEYQRNTGGLYPTTITVTLDQ